MEDSKTFDQASYITGYKADHYDRLVISTLPKGRKAQIAEQARSRGYASTTAYILALIDADMAAK